MSFKIWYEDDYTRWQDAERRCDYYKEEYDKVEEENK